VVWNWGDSILSGVKLAIRGDDMRVVASEAIGTIPRTGAAMVVAAVTPEVSEGSVVIDGRKWRLTG